MQAHGCWKQDEGPLTSIIQCIIYIQSIPNARPDSTSTHPGEAQVHSTATVLLLQHTVVISSSHRQTQSSITSINPSTTSRTTRLLTSTKPGSLPSGTPTAAAILRSAITVNNTDMPFRSQIHTRPAYCTSRGFPRACHNHICTISV